MDFILKDVEIQEKILCSKVDLIDICHVLATWYLIYFPVFVVVGGGSPLCGSCDQCSPPASFPSRALPLSIHCRRRPQCGAQNPGLVSHRTLALEKGEGPRDLGNYFQQYGLNQMAASGHDLGNGSCGLFSLESSLFLPPGSPAFLLIWWTLQHLLSSFFCLGYCLACSQELWLMCIWRRSLGLLGTGKVRTEEKVALIR